MEITISEVTSSRWNNSFFAADSTLYLKDKIRKQSKKVVYVLISLFYNGDDNKWKVRHAGETTALNGCREHASF